MVRSHLHFLVLLWMVSDIDECADPESNPCEGICNNTPGSYFCTCPKGTIDYGEKDGVRCIPQQKEFPVLQFTLGDSSIL